MLYVLRRCIPTWSVSLVRQSQRAIKALQGLHISRPRGENLAVGGFVKDKLGLFIGKGEPRFWVRRACEQALVVSGNSANVLALSLKTVLKLVLNLKFLSELRVVRQAPIVRSNAYSRGASRHVTL